IETEDGNPLSRQRLLFALEPAAPGKRQREHENERGGGSGHSSIAKRLRSERRGHLGGASAQACRRGKVIRQALVKVERAALAPRFEPGERCQLDSSRPPGIAAFR